jgi:hypothetical protein
MVEQLYVYECSNVHVTFGIFLLPPQMQVLAESKHQRESKFKDCLTITLVLTAQDMLRHLAFSPRQHRPTHQLMELPMPASNHAS